MLVNIIGWIGWARGIALGGEAEGKRPGAAKLLRAAGLGYDCDWSGREDGEV